MLKPQAFNNNIQLMNQLGQSIDIMFFKIISV